MHIARRPGQIVTDPVITELDRYFVEDFVEY